MNPRVPFRPDPRLDLVLERVIDVPPERVWAAFTRPEHVVAWFTPAPWTTVDCEIDLRPGGMFRTVMRSPEGEDHPNVGCYLEVEENERLVWTDALEPGWRPAAEPFMTAMILLEPHGSVEVHGHRPPPRRGEPQEARRDGVHEGWGKALDQLVEHMKSR
jgi:uncharacterized protein YndB with AHSA1/START domain